MGYPVSIFNLKLTKIQYMNDVIIGFIIVAWVLILIIVKDIILEKRKR
jgi:hypothetical protein